MNTYCVKIWFEDEDGNELVLDGGIIADNIGDAIRQLEKFIKEDKNVFKTELWKEN